jgi:uncharacterized protein
MIRPELLEILRCPETHQRLSPAPPELVESLNSRIRAGQLQNRSGQTVREPIEAALLREDRQFAYPIRAKLPIMLIGEALPIS